MQKSPDQIGGSSTVGVRNVDNAKGAMLTIKNVLGGLYQITLSDEAWIDVIQNGAALSAIDFTGAAGCPGLRKSVRFQLEAGGFVLQLSSASVNGMLVAIRKVK